MWQNYYQTDILDKVIQFEIFWQNIVVNLNKDSAFSL